jgi:hypothetical protein
VSQLFGVNKNLKNKHLKKLNGKFFNLEKVYRFLLFLSTALISKFDYISATPDTIVFQKNDLLLVIKLNEYFLLFLNILYQPLNPNLEPI